MTVPDSAGPETGEGREGGRMGMGARASETTYCGGAPGKLFRDGPALSGVLGGGVSGHALLVLMQVM